MRIPERESLKIIVRKVVESSPTARRREPNPDIPQRNKKPKEEEKPSDQSDESKIYAPPGRLVPNGKPKIETINKEA